MTARPPGSRHACSHNRGRNNAVNPLAKRKYIASNPQQGRVLGRFNYPIAIAIPHTKIKTTQPTTVKQYSLQLVYPHFGHLPGVYAVVSSTAGLPFPSPQPEPVPYEGEPTGALSQRVLYPSQCLYHKDVLFHVPRDAPIAIPAGTRVCMHTCCRSASKIENWVLAA